MKILSFLLLLFLSLSHIHCGNGTETGNPSDPGTGANDEGDGDGIDSDEEDEQAACEDAGGTWTEFEDSCADICDADLDACENTVTESCDCGETDCWDGSQCANS